MSTKYQDIFAALAAPFPQEELKYNEFEKFWYPTARSINNRLDTVLGPENWEGEPLPWNETAIKYRLTITLPDGVKVTKYGIGAKSRMYVMQVAKLEKIPAEKRGLPKTDPGDDDKGGESDAKKRAAAEFGIARYLYGEGTATLAGNSNAVPQQAQKPQDTRTQRERLIGWCAKEGHSGRLQAIARSSYNRTPEELSEDQARAIYKLIKDSGAVADLPQPPRNPETEPPARGAMSPMPTPTQAPGTNGNGNAVKFGWPHSGVSLYAWMKNIEKAFGTSIVPLVVENFCGAHVAPEQRLDPSFRTWNPHQVEAGAVFAAQQVSKMAGYSGEFDGKLPLNLQQIRDRLWKATGELVEALGQSPTSETIEAEIHRTSQTLAPKFGGEVIGELETCESEAILIAVMEVIEGDLKDAKSSFGA